MPRDVAYAIRLQSFRHCFVSATATTHDHVLEPFLLDRRLLPKVWGGRALQDTLGIELPSEQPFGEAWELFDRPDGSSRVRGSKTELAELVRRDPVALVGKDVPLGHGGSFPLMLKFLDAQQALSLQVHPDDRRAALDGGNDGGKDECCVILQATPDARMVHGVKAGVTREQFLAGWETEAVAQMVYSFRPEIGDLVHIPPGTVHGIGPGVLAFEVQQNSDLTYRFYDWGRGREVHLDRARGAVDVVANEARPVVPPTARPDGGQLLLATSHFIVRRYDCRQPIKLPTNGGYLTITALAGSGHLRWSHAGNECKLALRGPDTALVPACVTAVTLVPDENLDVVICEPGAR